MQVQGDGISNCKDNNVPTGKLEFNPKLRSSAFGGIIPTWVIKFPDDYGMIDPVFLLQEAVKSMEEIITNHLYEHTKKLKYTMSIHAIFHHGCDPGVKSDPAVVLTTDPVSVYLGTDLDECLREAAGTLMKLIEEYEGVGSGWVFDHFEQLDVSLNSF